MVESQAMRSSVRVDNGSESSTSAGGAPTSFFKPSSVVVTVTWGLTPLRRGSALVERVLHQLADGIHHPL